MGTASTLLRKSMEYVNATQGAVWLVSEDSKTLTRRVCEPAMQDGKSVQVGMGRQILVTTAVGEGVIGDVAANNISLNSWTQTLLAQYTVAAGPQTGRSKTSGPAPLALHQISTNMRKW